MYIYIIDPHICMYMYLFDWREFLLALHGERAQIRLHVLQEFLHRFRTAGRHLHTHSTLIQLLLMINNSMKPSGICFGSSARHINIARCRSTHINKRVCLQPHALSCVAHMIIIMLIVMIERLCMMFMIYTCASRLSFMFFSSFLDPHNACAENDTSRQASLP